MNMPTRNSIPETGVPGIRRGQAVYAPVPPEPDGDIGTPFWQQLPAQVFRSLRPLEEWVNWRRQYRTPPLPHGTATVRAAWDTQALYFAFECGKRYGPRRPWNGGDGVGIVVQPDPLHPAMQCAVTDQGEVSVNDAVSRGIRTAVRHEQGRFILHVVVPFSALNTACPVVGTAWYVNFTRIEQPLGEPTAWSHTGSDGDPAGLGLLTFVREPIAPAVLCGRIEDARPDDGLVVESPAGFCFADETGAFRIADLLPGPTTLRIGAFGHRAKTTVANAEVQSAGTVVVSLQRLPEKEVARKRSDAAQTLFHFGARYEDDPVHRDYQGCPSVCVLPNGGLLATYTCSSGEDVHNAIIVDSSEDDGRTWRQEFVLKPGDYRASWGNLWVDPLHRVWMFHQLWRPGIPCLYATRCDQFHPGSRDWTVPRVMCEALPYLGDLSPRRFGRPHGADHKFINKPVVLSDGAWLAPVESNEHGTRSVYAVVSEDRGETWTLRGCAPIADEIREISEPMVVERLDGALWMLIRVRQGMAESVSRDGGRTWSRFERSLIPHCSSRFFLRRLTSGRLMLIKHGPMHRTNGREDVTAYMSEDDGKSWPHGLLLCSGRCSYPDADQDASGRIHVVHDRGRIGSGAEILHSVFHEEDIIAGCVSHPSTRLNQLVARTGPSTR